METVIAESYHHLPVFTGRQLQKISDGVLPGHVHQGLDQFRAQADALVGVFNGKGYFRGVFVRSL